MNTTTAYTATRSNIFGATGLPRSVLAGWFRSNGLFGQDSELSPAEQSMVQARLPAIPGLRMQAAAVCLTPRHAAVGALVDALLAGRDAGFEAKRAQAEGMKRSAVSEVATVVGDALAVFGPFATAAAKARATGTMQPLSIAA